MRYKIQHNARIADGVQTIAATVCTLRDMLEAEIRSAGCQSGLQQIGRDLSAGLADIVGDYWNKPAYHIRREIQLLE